MIASDQFKNLPEELLFVFSSRSDGTVLDRSKATHDPAVLEQRQSICEEVGISYDDVVYQRIVYSETATYDVIVDVDKSSTTKHIPEVAADALFTKQPGVGLFLPVADCIVTVLYDPNKRFLAQLHMGRHSTLTNVLEKMVSKFVREGSNTADIRVWMAPSVTKAHYKLDYFTEATEPKWQPYVEHKEDGYYLDMQGFNQNVLVTAGIPSSNITISPIDTYENQNYFSHYRGDIGGRFAGIAMIRPHLLH